MFAAPADLAQRLKQAIKAAKLSPGLLVEYSVYYPQHEDEVLKAFKELEELTDTPDVEAFVKRVLKGAAGAEAVPDTSPQDFQNGLRNANPSPPLKLQQEYIDAMTDRGLRIPVPEYMYNEWQTKGLDLQFASLLLPVTTPSALAYSFGNLINDAPQNGHTELTTTFAMFNRASEVVKAFERFGSLEHEFTTYLNSTEPGTTSRALISGKRPDFAASAYSCTLLIGEDKMGGDIQEAVDDISRKCPGFNVLHYGEVQYIFAYAAAGYDVQWYLIDQKGEMVNVGPQLSLGLLAGRIRVLHIMLNVFRVMKYIVGSQLLPPIHKRYQLFVMHQRGTSEIVFNNDAAIKHIPDYDRFASANHTNLQVLKRAYNAAAMARDEQMSNKKKPFMVWAAEGPEVTLRSNTLRVTIKPLGGPMSVPTQEQELGQMVYAWCNALSVLHKEGIVLRDIRSPNIAKLGESWLVLDYEHCGVDGELLPPDFTLKEWDAKTLIDPPAPVPGKQGWRVYDQYSDMYQLGVAISPYIKPGYSDYTSKLLQGLRARELKATDVLRDWQQWFIHCGVK